ncbi:epoxide hydrolase family protein [Nocardia sp. CDC160]|uniref:epoxide hydrolase family protein n=1 Tax=Nocardia sp. CDC160 TaxID=3112166 RepID=UPI002DBEDF48|nr:epoxide hydrolase [Nocardia sp. CDC160]MEC3917898.1 epoxide hydrolase [Nocardia sp. CDC160]
MSPFRIDIPQPQLDDLRRRLAETRWPEREPVPDWSQGIPLDTMRGLCRYWMQEYDWRATERRLNQIPQFHTTIDGLPIHFLHVRSPRPDATPVVLTHGWPGAFLEFEQVIAPLTDPPHDESAFHVVVPSLPGYAFSGKPATTGWGIERIARAWCELMTRLDYPRFLAAGSDWGTSISTSIALQQPERLIGLHLVPPLVPPDHSAPFTDAERASLADLEERTSTGSGYSAIHGTRPQTVGYGLTDSPAGLAAWIAEKLCTWTDDPGLTRDQILDNVTLYWLTRTATSSIRLYWESIAQVSRWFTAAVDDTIDVPTGCTVYPKEVPRPSRRWAARRFTNIVHWSEPTRGGHFAAWEQPDLFVADLRATDHAIRSTNPP